MKALRHIVGYLVFFCTLGLPAFPQEVLQEKVKNIIRESEQSGVYWAISVLDETGKPIVSINPNSFIGAASNQKLFTTAALLQRYGPDYNITTPVLGAGEIRDSVFLGDVYIKGFGDPSMSGVFHSEQKYAPFEMLLEQLRAKGIHGIRGNLYLDLSFFDDEPYPKGWPWEDLSFYYAVPTSAIAFNNNTVDLTVDASGEVGSVPGISWFPENTPFVEFINEQTITFPGTKYNEYYRRYPGTNTILLRSEVPRGYEEKESLSIGNPEGFFATSLIQYLKTQNFEWIHPDEMEYSLRTIAGVETLDTLAVWHSPPMQRLINRINQESDNFIAEMLAKKMGADEFNESGSFEKGVLAIRSALSEIGMDTSRIVMYDGSGLSVYGVTTAGVFADLMWRMKTHKNADSFRESLSVAGINGTLKNRMKGTELYKKFTGKTGFMTGIRSLTGYLKTAGGRELTVSIVANRFTEKVSQIDAIQQAVLKELYHAR